MGMGQQAPEAPAGTDAGAAGLSQSQQALFARGASALRAGNAERATEIFQRLVKAAPELAAAHANLGTALMMRGKKALAKSAYKHAIALNPGLVEAQVRLGVLYRRSGQYAKAEAAYKAALARQPDNRYAHINLGILYDVYLRQPAKAVRHYKRFRELSEQPDQEVARWIKAIQQGR